MPSPQGNISGGNPPAATVKSPVSFLLRLLAVIPLAGCALAAFVVCLPFTLLDALRNRLRPDARAE